MQAVDWLGFVGVFQILLAYFLNVTGKVTNNSLIFMFLNLIGATIACIAYSIRLFTFYNFRRNLGINCLVFINKI
jgi:hypothetical protein